ncbi:MAG: hypothetical protein HOY79_49685 [Streptomyces sp.]|nr:hypothetical protein [Streptomyces sp.]
MRAGIAAGLVNATEAAHNLATDDVGRALGQFLVSETEVMEISDAGARIIGRKLPKGLGNRDFEDFARLGMAVASYVGRQVSIWKKARAARRQIESVKNGQNGGEEAA